MSTLKTAPKSLLTPDVRNFINLVQSEQDSGDAIRGDELLHIQETTIASGDELRRKLAALPQPQANMDSDTPGFDAALNFIFWLVVVIGTLAFLAIHFGFIPGM